MRNYCLTIYVRSQNEALLNNLIVTLETLNENMNEIDTIEMFSSEKEGFSNNSVNKKTQLNVEDKEIFLDTWKVAEE